VYFWKQQLEYKSFYMFGNIHPILVILALKDLIETSLYTNLNVTIHLQWISLFVMHITLSIQIDDKYMSSCNKFDSKNEKHIDYAPMNSMAHNLNASIIN